MPESENGEGGAAESLQDHIAEKFDRAVQHHQAGDLAKAEVIYREIQQIMPDQPVILNMLGAIVVLPAAIWWFCRAPRRRPQPTETVATGAAAFPPTRAPLAAESS